MSRLLGVGTATLDIVNHVPRYPQEDEELRASSQRLTRGGNVTNTLAILRQFGHECDWAGCYADDSGADILVEDLVRRGIGIHAAVRCADSATPTSYICLSDATASRTIVHYRRLREFNAADFSTVSLAGYHWIHFEGRNPPETAAMIERVRRERPLLPISVELEKNRPELARLLQPVSVLLFSRTLAQPQLSDDTPPWDFLAEQQRHSGATLCIAPWGAVGAYGINQAGKRLFAPAAPPECLRDTLAAGDVFNATLIDSLLRKYPASEAMSRANRVAGFKCGRFGLDGLVDALTQAPAFFQGPRMPSGLAS